MKIENIQIRKSKYVKGDDLQRGVAGLTIKDLGIDIRNIPYYVTKDREIIVQPPAIAYSEREERDGKVEHKLVPTISFHDSSIWDSIVEAVKKAVVVE